LILVGISPYPIGDSSDKRLPHIARKAQLAIAKTALGAEECVNWQHFDSFDEAAEDLRQRGFTILAIEQDKNSLPLYRFSPDKPTALVVGPEVSGLDKTILEACDAVYEIPMRGRKESFNVSVAAAIALYQARL